MPTSTSPIPSDAPFTGPIVMDPQTRQIRAPYMSDDFANWLLEQQTRLNQAPQSIGEAVSLTDQTASIGATPAYVAETTGVYRVSVYARIVRAGTISSSLSVTIGATDKTIAIAELVKAAVTGNTTATVYQGAVIVRCDQSQAITYATTYATAGATTMAYDLVIVVELLPQQGSA
jgi:hypothetical protein